MSLAFYLVGFFVIFSYALYVVGFVGLIAGLVVLGNMANVPPQWIGASVMALIGLAVAIGVKRSRREA